MNAGQRGKTAIFLGAGASKAEGAPMQDELFKEYFRPARGQHQGNGMRRELAKFFKAMFRLNVYSRSKIEYPTFEEALGILDLAEMRRESFREFDLEGVIDSRNRIRFIRQALVLAMAKTIADKLKSVEGLHLKLVTNLENLGVLRNTVFISTNYDIIIDNALELHYKVEPGQPLMLDYGVEFSNLFEKPSAQASKLYKIHGSFNWLYCPTCNDLAITRYKKGVMDLVRYMELSRERRGYSGTADMIFQEMNRELAREMDLNRAQCRTCRSLRVPVIVPPTYYKDMSRVFLSLIWNKTEHALREVDHLIFCGYSFPDADMHIKYLLKRVQTNAGQAINFTVISNHDGKSDQQKKDEKNRYNRFLGGKVNYTEASFEEFAAAPADLYLRRRAARSTGAAKRRAPARKSVSARSVRRAR